MEKRQKYIIQRLRNTVEPISGNKLAEELDVSSRTIRTIIKQLNEQLKDYQAEIIPVQGSGYQLDVHNMLSFSKLWEIETVQNEKILTQAERQRWIVESLFYKEQYLKLDDAVENLYVSRSTISQDIKELKPALSAFQVTLESRPNYGLYLNGEEYQVRSFMLHAFPQNSANPLFEKFIHESAKDYGVFLHPGAALEITQYIEMAVLRNERGYLLKELPFQLERLKQEIEYKMARHLTAALKPFQVALTKCDDYFLTLLYIKHRVTSIENQLIPAPDQRYDSITEAIMKQLEQQLSLSVDPEWENRFRRHLLPAIKRASYGLHVQNPLLDEIKKQYSHAFDMALRANFFMKEKFGISLSEEEAGYLALHFQQVLVQNQMKKLHVAIICASGIGTAQILKRRIESLYREEIQIIGVYDKDNLQKKITDTCQLILSTVPITDEISYPVMAVNPLLPDHDQKKINAFIHQHNQSLFKVDLFFLDVEVQNSIEAIELLASALIAGGYAPDQLIPLTLEREEVSPTAFGGEIALPHPLTPCGNETVAAVALLKTPILWGRIKEKVDVVFLLSIKKDNDQEIHSFYDRLMLVLDDPMLKKRLCQQKTFLEFEQFWNQLGDFHPPASAK